jgi:hypothetical protein
LSERRSTIVGNNPDYYRLGNTVYGAKTRCSDSQCESNCVFPECCCEKNEHSTAAAADKAVNSLKLLKKKVEIL